MMGMGIRKNGAVPSRIRLARESRGYSQADLASLIDVSRQAVNQYEMGRVKPSDAVLLRLSGELNYPLAFFEKKGSVSDSGCPVFFRSRSTAKAHERAAACAKINIFKEIADYFERYLEFPAVNIPDVVYRNVCQELGMEDIEGYAMALREYWGLGDGPIPNLMHVIQRNGIMVSEMRIGYGKIDAFSVFRDGRPYIFLCRDKESNANLRFSIAHELGHMVMHSDLVDDKDLDKPVIDRRLEAEATIFAGAFLMPAESFGRDVKSSSIDHFVGLKGKWLASISSMIYRCDDLGLLSENQIRYLKGQMTKRGYWRREPLDDLIQIETPFLLKQATGLLLDSVKVSRSQIVDGIGCSADEIERYCFLEAGTLAERMPGNIIRMR